MTNFITLSETEIKEQLGYVVRYTNLLNKEIAMGDLMNLENINSYAKTIKHASKLIADGGFYMETIGA